jgi:predicted nucleic-acid-binding protein
MKRTYIDANVLIAAFQGEESVAQRAFQVLDDPDRKLVVSDYLRLEVLPKPTFHQQREEVEFMQSILDQAENVLSTSDLTGKSLEFANKYDLTPIDALHVGASAVAAVDELITMEKPTKPMCKVREINVKSLHSSKA